MFVHFRCHVFHFQLLNTKHEIEPMKSKQYRGGVLSYSILIVGVGGGAGVVDFLARRTWSRACIIIFVVSWWCLSWRASISCRCAARVVSSVRMNDISIRACCVAYCVVRSAMCLYFVRSAWFAATALSRDATRNFMLLMSFTSVFSAAMTTAAALPSVIIETASAMLSMGWPARWDIATKKLLSSFFFVDSDVDMLNGGDDIMRK